LLDRVFPADASPLTLPNTTDKNILLVQRNDRVGGNPISKENEKGFVWEEGPNSFQPTPFIARIIHELGLDQDLVLDDGSWTDDGAG
jgi:oxygen-dependent protoporphyrinogen oxidase